MSNQKLKNNELIELDVKGDSRGQLVVLESKVDVGFDIKRVFYIYGTQKTISRGDHAHYKTKQFLICINGYCKVTLQYADETKVYQLDEPNKGVFQDKMIWGSMHDFSEDCVLLVLADRAYEEKDYIRDHDVFLELSRNNKNL